jgi:tol-pal system protein YbgF
MMRASAAVFFCLWLAVPAAAQSQAEGEMRLYILQLEEHVRQLTGRNERLAYEVSQLRNQLGLPPLQEEPVETGAVTGQDLSQPPGEQAPDSTQQLGTLTVSPQDSQVVPDGTGSEGPVDLSSLAGGVAGELFTPEFGNPVPPGQQEQVETAGLPGAPPTMSLGGSARDEYDLAYGYVLTGDYELAEDSFKTWLAAFPGDPQQADAQFWLGESHLQQGEYRDAANAFLAVYKAAPESTKGPDALLKLGVSLSALGETKAACATFAEVGRKFPQVSPSLMSRVHDEEGRTGC